MKQFKLISITLFIVLFLFSCDQNKRGFSGMHDSIAHSFEEALENPSKISSISIENKEIETIPATINDRFTNLVQFNLTKNKLTHIPETIGDIRTIKYLHVSKNKLTTLPRSLENLKNIEMLFTAFNEITTLPDVPFYFKRNTIVDFRGNKITTLPPSFSYSRFGHLVLAGNPLDKLPENFGSIKDLQKLNISETNISELPDSFYQLKDLVELDIRKTKISKKQLVTLIKKLPNCKIRSDF